MLDNLVMLALTARIKVNEGFRSKPYADTVGKLTIGWGRNLNAEGITVGEALILLGNDISRCDTALLRSQTWYQYLDDVRKSVMIELAFNLGVEGILEFHDLWAALAAHEWKQAHDALLDSKAARELPARYATLANILFTGDLYG
jgi:lysozyme